MRNSSCGNKHKKIVLNSHFMMRDILCDLIKKFIWEVGSKKRITRYHDFELKIRRRKKRLKGDNQRKGKISKMN